MTPEEFSSGKSEVDFEAVSPQPTLPTPRRPYLRPPALPTHRTVRRARVTLTENQGWRVVALWLRRALAQPFRAQHSTALLSRCASRVEDRSGPHGFTRNLN